MHCVLAGYRRKIRASRAALEMFVVGKKKKTKIVFLLRVEVGPLFTRSGNILSGITVETQSKPPLAHSTRITFDAVIINRLGTPFHNLTIVFLAFWSDKPLSCSTGTATAQMLCFNSST